MSKFLSALTITIFMLSCNQAKPVAEEKKDSATTETKKADNISYPYKARYSSSFEMGKPEDVKTILDIWKAYEENKLSETKSLWGDTVTLQFDGFTFHGPVDSALKEGSADRGRYTSVKDSIDAVFPTHSIDRNEYWVGVWAREYTIDKKGKKDTTDLHEIWRLKDGKAVFASQFRAHHKP
jgi:hypothetical protein